MTNPAHNNKNSKVSSTEGAKGIVRLRFRVVCLFRGKTGTGIGRVFEDGACTRFSEELRDQRFRVVRVFRGLGFLTPRSHRDSRNQDPNVRFGDRTQCACVRM